LNCVLQPLVPFPKLAFVGLWLHLKKDNESIGLPDVEAPIAKVIETNSGLAEWALMCPLLVCLEISCCWRLSAACAMLRSEDRDNLVILVPRAPEETSL
jgi:hypothetical protein